MIDTDLLVCLDCFMSLSVNMRRLRVFSPIVVTTVVRRHHRVRPLVCFDVAADIGGRSFANLRRVQGNNRIQFQSSLDTLSAALLNIRSPFSLLTLFPLDEAGCRGSKLKAINDGFLNFSNDLC